MCKNVLLQHTRIRTCTHDTTIEEIANAIITLSDLECVGSEYIHLRVIQSYLGGYCGPPLNSSEQAAAKRKAPNWLG